jgi:hypothetical protein
MRGEVLLDRLPVGWSVRYEIIAGLLCPLFIHGKTVTQKDPRVPLPSSWRYRYSHGQNLHKSELSIFKNRREQYFENVATKEVTWYEPRPTPEALQERGFDIQELVLV